MLRGFLKLDSLEKANKLTSPLCPGQRRGQHGNAYLPFLKRAVCSRFHSIVSSWWRWKTVIWLRVSLTSEEGKSLKVWIGTAAPALPKSTTLRNLLTPWVSVACLSYKDMISPWRVLRRKYSDECEEALTMLINNKGRLLSGCYQTSGVCIPRRTGAWTGSQIHTEFNTLSLSSQNDLKTSFVTRTKACSNPEQIRKEVCLVVRKLL